MAINNYGVEFRPFKGESAIGSNIQIGSSPDAPASADLLIHVPIGSISDIRDYEKRYKNVMWLGTKDSDNRTTWHAMDRKDVENLCLYLFNFLADLDSVT